MIRFLSVGLLVTLGTLVAGEDAWEPVVENGFGIAGQLTVPEMEVYKGNLYVATAPLTGSAEAKLWRTGPDTLDWKDVTPDLDGDVSIHAFGQTDSGGGYFWLGTGRDGGTVIYQSRDGSFWQAISHPGFGNDSLLGAAPNMVVFRGPADTTAYLYAGAGSHGGGAAAEVWRIPYTSENPDQWEKLIDFDTLRTPAEGLVDMITYFEIWHDKIYFGTNAQGQIWESSDGKSFSLNQGVRYGFAPAYTGNQVISAMEIFNDTMYVTTTNFSGGQMFRSSDGLTFINITADAFGESLAVSELRKPVVAFGHLWVTGYTEPEHSTGTPVWRSANGIDWIRSNTNGFGDTLINGQNACLAGYGDYMYCGAPDYAVGGQVWRTHMDSTGIHDVRTPPPAFPASGGTPVYYDLTGKPVSVTAIQRTGIYLKRQGLLLRRICIIR